MEALIIKAGATGDVVRTTPLLGQYAGEFTWLAEDKNIVLLQGLQENLSCIPWTERHLLKGRRYDLVINLEDQAEAAALLDQIEFGQLWGAYADSTDRMHYTDDSKTWFDLSIISAHGKERADALKLQNRQTYQALIFDGLGFRFAGETYLVPPPIETGLLGDVAIAADSGHVWPMKKWAYYGELKQRLEREGLIVNVLPQRASLLEHLADVRNHRCLVGGDSLPMHFALGTQTPCVSLFTCTSPWEIYHYSVQKKIISPLLEEFFYKRGYDGRATTAISVEEVFDAVITQLETISSGRNQSAA